MVEQKSRARIDRIFHTDEFCSRLNPAVRMSSDFTRLPSRAMKNFPYLWSLEKRCGAA